MNDPDALHGKKMEKKKMNGILHFVLHRVDLACFPFIVYEFGVLAGGVTLRGNLSWDEMRGREVEKYMFEVCPKKRKEKKV